MISDIEKYVDFLTKNKITEHQFLILWLVHTKDVKSIAKYKRANGDFSLDAVNDLIDKGWINDFGIKDKGRPFDIFNYVVTDKFTEVVLIDQESAYEQLCKVYPKWFVINGIRVPAISGDPYTIEKEYFKCYKGDRIEHERIVSITEKYFKNKPPMAKIENYIKNRMWNLIEETLPGQGNNLDAFKQL